MSVLITGGAGFIGANLVKTFKTKSPKTEIVVLDDLSTGRISNLDGVDVRFVEGSVANPDQVGRAMQGVSSVVHLAALGSVPRSVKEPIASHDANLNGTLTILEEARRRNAYVAFASSSSVYGANDSIPKSEFDWTRPMSPYAVTKLGAEGYVLAYQFSYGLRTLVFRFFNVYGPLQSSDHAYAAVIPKFIDALRRGAPLVVEGDGNQSRDFTYVNTVCEVLYDAVARQVTSPDPVNLAYGTSTSVNDLIARLEDVTGMDATVRHAEPRTGDVRASQSNGIRVRELFPGVEPTGLDRGLQQTAEWFGLGGHGSFQAG